MQTGDRCTNNLQNLYRFEKIKLQFFRDYMFVVGRIISQIPLCFIVKNQVSKRTVCFSSYKLEIIYDKKNVEIKSVSQ